MLQAERRTLHGGVCDGCNQPKIWQDSNKGKMQKARVLVIDDESAIRKFLRSSLPREQFEVDEASTGREGITKAALHPPDIVLLDLGLPDMDGLEVASEIRQWSQVPIIVVSARFQDSDKISVLDAGADDYLTKPFSVGELMARIRVAIRHSKKEDQSESPLFEYQGVKVDFVARMVWKDGVEIHLTPNEYSLLSVLIRHAGRVLTHRQLLERVWGDTYSNEVQYLRVYMRQLRNKLEENSATPKLILTEPGVGYRLKVD